MKHLKLLISFLLFTGSLFAQQTFEWGITAGGPNSDVINDITSFDNDIFITGRFNGDFTSGNENVKCTANNDVYLARLNAKGGTKWLQTLSGKGINSASRLAVSGEEILVGGIISETVKQEKKTFPGEGKSVFVSS